LTFLNVLGDYFISHEKVDAEVKLCNLYQFFEAFNDIARCKIFRPSLMFHHFTINCIWLMLFFTNSNKFWYWSNS